MFLILFTVYPFLRPPLQPDGDDSQAEEKCQTGTWAGMTVETKKSEERGKEEGRSERHRAALPIWQLRLCTWPSVLDGCEIMRNGCVLFLPSSYYKQNGLIVVVWLYPHRAQIFCPFC